MVTLEKTAHKLAEIAMEEVKECGKDSYLLCHDYLRQLRAKGKT